MTKQVIWTKGTLEFFIQHANLTETEQAVMRSRAQNKPRSWQVSNLHVSMSTLDRTIRRLKQVYDRVQSENPDMLPPRKESAQELYMDTH